MIAESTRLALALLFLFSFGGCMQKPEPPIRVGAIVWPGYECFFLARTLGFFEGAPVQLVEYTSSSEALRGFKNHTLEAAALSGDEFLRLAEQEPDARIIAILDISHGADGLVSQAGITNLASLKGLRIGVEPNSVGVLILLHALEAAGLTRNDVTVVHADNSEQEKMFIAGAFDAVATFEPVKSRLLKKGANLLFDSKRMNGKIVDVLAVRESSLRREPERFRKLMRAWFRARDFLLAQPGKASEMMAARERLSPDDFSSAMKGLILPSEQEMRQYLQPGRDSIGPRLQSVSEYLLSKGLLKKPVDAAERLAPWIIGEPR
jgi:NitT/TauT family transport system substrate-binding protein